MTVYHVGVGGASFSRIVVRLHVPHEEYSSHIFRKWSYKTGTLVVLYPQQQLLSNSSKVNLLIASKQMHLIRKSTGRYSQFLDTLGSRLLQKFCVRIFIAPEIVGHINHNTFLKLNIEVWWRSYFMAESVLRHTHSHSTHAFRESLTNVIQLNFNSYICVWNERKKKCQNEDERMKPGPPYSAFGVSFILFTHTNTPMSHVFASWLRSKYTRICFMSHKERQINEKEKKAMRLKIKCSSTWIWETGIVTVLWALVRVSVWLNYT